MIEYLILFLLVLSQVYISDFLNIKSHDFIFKKVIFLFIILIVGLRYKVGIDTYNYMIAYKSIPDLYAINYRDIFNYHYQPFFLLLLSFCKTIFTQDFYWVQIMHSLILNYAIFRFIDKNTSYFYTGILLYLLTFFMYFNFEILKESLAISIFLLNIDSLTNNRYKKYYLGVLIAIMFHMSAIILLLLPFVKKIRFNKSFFIVLIVFLVLLIFSRQYISLLGFNEKLFTKVDAYVNIAESGLLNMNWVILQIIQITLVPILLVYLSPKDKIEKITYLLCIYILLGIGTIYYQIIFLRFTNYFIPFVILACLYIVTDKTQKYRNKKMLGCIMVIAFLLVYNYNFLSHGGVNRWYPYNSILNPKSIKERDRLFNEFNAFE